MKNVGECPLCKGRVGFDGIPEGNWNCPHCRRSISVEQLDWQPLLPLESRVEDHAKPLSKSHEPIAAEPSQADQAEPEPTRAGIIDPSQALVRQSDVKQTGNSTKSKRLKVSDSPVPSPFNPQLPSRPRARRQQRSAFREFVRIVAGGIAGLAIGQLILWWLPGELRQDPFDLAKRLPAPAQFLAPDELRGDDQ